MPVGEDLRTKLLPVKYHGQGRGILRHGGERALRLLSACGVGALLFLHEPARHTAIAVIRFPLTVANAGLGILLAIPRLPALLHDREQLQAELMRRQLEIARLQETLRTAHRVHGFTPLFLERAGFTDQAVASHGVLAQVIGRSILPTQHTVLLGKGQGDGLTLDTVVIDPEGVVGRLVELHLASALVLLVTDPDSRVAALVERSRETGLLVGRGLSQCEFVYLDGQADITVGDRVVTAGWGGTFPKGLPLGTITRVSRDEQAAVTTAWVEPAARLSRLEDVLCLPTWDGREHHR